MRQSGETPENPFLLIGADLSGIQTYIYQIVSKYAAKNLKGRSFYLRLLTDTVVTFLLGRLELFRANVIYNSGGGFYIIAPNTGKVRAALQEAVATIEGALFNTHATSLFLAIDSIEVSRDALQHRNGDDLGKVWGRLFNRKDKKKNARYCTLLQSDYKRFFTPSSDGGDCKVDIVTGEGFNEGEREYSEKGLSPLRKTTKEQIQLGQALKDFDVMVVSRGEIGVWSGKMHIQPLNLGIYYYFVKTEDINGDKQQLAQCGQDVTFVVLNDDEAAGSAAALSGLPANVRRFEFYGGNGVSRGLRSTFEEMCEGLTADAFERMGILRMDVDNLGHIFQQGIAPERCTLSRMSALSRSFDYFFSGYLNTIWREESPARSFIVYSGGDDLFIVGSWDVTIRLAERIHDDFKRFTCQNPAFSISGGIAITESDFPIIKGAEMSAGEESNAKNHVCGGASKNSLSFMGTALNFDKEYPQVKALKTAISAFIHTEIIPKSFISKVHQHWENAGVKNHQITNVKTFWMMTYDLSRMAQRINDQAARSLIDACKTEVCTRKATLGGKPITTGYHPLELWAFACRWAELELRTFDNNQ